MANLAKLASQHCTSIVTACDMFTVVMSTSLTMQRVYSGHWQTLIFSFFSMKFLVKAKVQNSMANIDFTLNNKYMDNNV